MTERSQSGQLDHGGPSIEGPWITWPLEAIVDDVRPLTIRERWTGWRTVTLRSGLTVHYAVGWRARRMARERRTSVTERVKPVILACSFAIGVLVGMEWPLLGAAAGVVWWFRVGRRR